MSRTIEREFAGPDWRLWPQQVCGGANWAKIFGEPNDDPLRLVVDVGFGGGEFLLDLARRDPAGAYVGIELDFSRVLKVARRLSRTSIGNVRLIGIAAEWSIREAFADGTVSEFWINFPDPWPKRRHWRRRIVSPRIVSVLTRKLAAGGSLHVGTDAPDYAPVIDEVLSSANELANAFDPDRHRPERGFAPRTAFEDAWRAKGRRCFYFHYERKREGAAAPHAPCTPCRSNP